MPSWVCRVGTSDGGIAVRTVEAPDEAALRNEMVRQGAYLFSARPADVAAGAGGLLSRLFPARGGARRERRIGTREFLVFNQELVALLKAGLPIVAGLDILIERQDNPRLKAILQDVRGQLVSGVALSDAFLSHGEVFPRLYATSLRAGERSGEVEAVLRRYLRYQKLLGAVRRRVTGALVYPAVLVGLSIGLVTILMTYVIPKFVEFFAGFDVGQLPLLTRIVIGTAQFMKARFPFILAVVVAGSWGLSRWRRTEAGGRALDGILLRLPLVGGILHQFALSQFARALATLVGAGTPVVPALEISSGAIANRKIAGAVASVVPRVREGTELWRSLEETGEFTSLAVEMIKVGEATGALEEMLVNVSDFYDEAIDVSLQRLISLIEPIILVVMGSVVATILLSVYLPLFTILSRIRG